MLYSRGRRAVVTSALLTSVLVSACRDNDGPAGNTTTTAAVAERDPVSVVIQMTGLLLLVPPKGNEKLTHILLPQMDTTTHVAFMAFRGDSISACKFYQEGLCLVDLTGWSLDSIGAGAAAPTPAGRIPHGVANLTKGSGGITVNLDSARSRIRGQISMLNGHVTDSCSRARWSINPVGSPPPERFSLINMLEWQISDLRYDSLIIVRRTLAPPDSVERIAVAADTSREIEVLILHLTRDEFDDLNLPVDISSTQQAGTGPTRESSDSIQVKALHALRPQDADTAEDPRTEIDLHFHAFYDVMKVDSVRRRLPRRPVLIEYSCPITVLGLEEYVIEAADFGVREADALSFMDGRAGASTLSCVMASAEQS